jgi:biotin carboxylase
VERLSRRVELIPFGPDAEADPGSFDAVRFVDRAADELARLQVAGVVSSSDYPGCLVAAVIAERMGLPGPAPQAVLRAAHKYVAREVLAAAVPESTPRFHLVDPEYLDVVADALTYPVFVKPVKSWFSQLARRIDSLAELTDYVRSTQVRRHLQHFVRPLNQLLDGYPEFTLDAAHILAEEVLVGAQVTLEGYVFDGKTTVLTIVDSQMHPGTTSFARFVVPSVVSREQADAMAGISERAVRGLGLTHGLFNIEFIYDSAERSCFVVEINPRMCGQFADMTEHVTGVNTYEILVALGLGRRPAPTRDPRNSAAAASYPLRHFADGWVAAVPSAAQIARVRRALPASLVAIYYEAGNRLSSRPKHFDGASYRYACINLVASGREQLDPLMRQVEQQLGIVITDP